MEYVEPPATARGIKIYPSAKAHSLLKIGQPGSVAHSLQKSTSQGPLGARILVVDDEDEVVAALTMRLKFAGYEVYSAYDGASASQAVLKIQPDLIILDIGMPRGDGHAVARGLTDHLNALLVPIIFLTARTSQTDRDKAASVGAAGYLAKPYTSRCLLETVAQAFAWQKPLQSD